MLEKKCLYVITDHVKYFLGIIEGYSCDDKLLNSAQTPGMCAASRGLLHIS